MSQYFNWIDDKLRFFTYVLQNLLIFPNVPISVKKAFQYRDLTLLLHAPFLFLSTVLNVYFTLRSRSMFKQLFS